MLKKKTDNELLHHYLLINDENYLTNLGVLWIGTQFQRASITNASVVQVIKYDSDGNKINKIQIDDNTRSPKEIIEYLLQNVADWKETYEVVGGLFRIEIPAYDIVVVRELLVNALVHRPYTTRGDIFINLTPDNMEIKNPGRFPLGITVQNILVKSVQRNPNFSKIFYDLQLMEKEGSGYDIMFERLLTEGKSIPHVFEGDDFVSVKIERKFKNAELVNFMNKASLFYELNQKEKICLGIIVQNESISSIELSKKLSIKDSDTLNAYLKKLLKNNLIELQGKTKGATYTVTPTIFKQIKFQTHATLKTIEPYRLKELIFQDLQRYGSASFSEIQNRIGKEISKKKIRAQLAELIEKDKTVKKDGDRRWTKYIFIKKN